MCLLRGIPFSVTWISGGWQVCHSPAWMQRAPLPPCFFSQCYNMFFVEFSWWIQINEVWGNFFVKMFIFPCDMVKFLRWVHLDGEAPRGPIATSLAQPHHVWAPHVSAAAGGVAPHLVCCATAGRGQDWLGFFALGWWWGGHFADSNWHDPKLCWNFVSFCIFFVSIRGIPPTREWCFPVVAPGTAPFSLWKRVIEMDCILFLGQIRLDLTSVCKLVVRLLASYCTCCNSIGWGRIGFQRHHLGKSYSTPSEFTDCSITCRLPTYHKQE